MAGDDTAGRRKRGEPRDETASPDASVVRVGILGTGDIVPGYLATLDRIPWIRVTAIASRDPDRSRNIARRLGVPRALTPEELVESPEVDLVLVLTEPEAHAAGARAALQAGKHVYCEKPLTLETAEAESLASLARDCGVTLACAPDVFLGSAVQEARAALDRGDIGRPVGALAVVSTHGMEDWHPRPAGFYAPGSGPLFDLGPYPITRLLALLGPVRRVTGMATRGDAERTSSRGPAAGTRFPVLVDTHVTGLLQFECGVVATLVTSVEVWDSTMTGLEIYGTEGVLSLSEPNYGGEARVRRRTDDAWRRLGHRSTGDRTTDSTPEGYGMGLADQAIAVAEGRRPRADAQLAVHTLEIMNAIVRSAGSGEPVELRTTCQAPEPIGGDWWPPPARR